MPSLDTLDNTEMPSKTGDVRLKRSVRQCAAVLVGVSEPGGQTYAGAVDAMQANCALCRDILWPATTPTQTPSTSSTSENAVYRVTRREPDSAIGIHGFG